MSIHALHDDHGRTVRYLRLSLTDRCNLRCLYCHSNARHQCIPHEKMLRYEEMIRLVQIVRGMGVGKVRLTRSAAGPGRHAGRGHPGQDQRRGPARHQ